eukprot:TRINITY_DN37164_c0_g1_i1.p1 TRINITY_DN37164_c0_g1~~TRINITY_DN37164_c0_g1_i1.p1  ORF type:complete len:421 (+),score=107.29 TRINITY_DN37164_c0_g1_i1:162-1424(+)
MAAGEAEGAKDRADRPPRLTCIGSPQLEIHAEVTQELFSRHEVQANTDVQVEEKHWTMLGEILQSHRDGSGAGGLEYAIGGGAGLAARTVRALTRANERGKLPGDEEGNLEVMLLGSVGKDDMGTRLRQICAGEGIGVLFSDTDAVVTGWRAVLRTPQPQAQSHRIGEGLGPPPGAEPSDYEHMLAQPRQVGAMTFYGAAREYKLDHLRFKVWQQIEATSVVYVDAHFLTVASESVRIVAEHCATMGKLFCLNLSAYYICSFFGDLVLQVVPYTDYIFGNENEYLGLVQSQGSREDAARGLEGALDWLAKIPRADGNERRRRRVIATAGSRPCVLASTWRGYGVVVQRFPVPPVRTGRFVTKDGAGEAFAGGFLYGLMREATLESCVQLALFAAQAAVQRTRPAFVFKDKPPLEQQTLAE